MSRKPTKFVGLHSHSTFSVGDAIGTPADHIKYAAKNGMDALALTDHGNMNGMSHQLIAAEKLAKSGQKFKALPGVEAYFIPSLSDWMKLKEQRQAEKEAAKAKVKKKTDEEQLELVGDPFASAKEEMDASVAPQVNEEEEGGTVVENEEESKQKVRDPLYQRNHLVLLPKNAAGLKSLYKLVSDSYIDGFYRYPRMDFDMLKREAKGNIVALSACMAGYPAKLIFDYQTEPDWTKWTANDDNFEQIQAALKESIERFKHAMGDENYYLEIQFNKLGAQHLINYHLIEAAKRTNTKLVATCDAHYSDPNHWRERELYKLMAWMSKTKGDLDQSKIPQKIDDLKCELYPKNAEQMWDSYKSYCSDFSFYNDDIVCDAIEQSYVIAHEQIGEVKPDRTVKLPVLEKLVPADEYARLNEAFPDSDEDALAYKELIRVAKAGLINRKKHTSQEYIDRLKHELQVIKELKFAKYFLTYAKIMEVVSSHMMIGNARGSAGGSLLSYCLGITQVDPIRFGLLFERFLVRGKKGFPDIDSDFGDRELATKLIGEYFGKDNVISVSNFTQLQVTSLVKDLARLFNVPFEEVNAYTNKMRNEALAKAKQEPGFDAAVWQFTVETAEKDSPSFREFMEKMKQYPEFEMALTVLFKQMRGVSRHAGGVIITENPRENMPIIKSGGQLQTPWPEGLNFRHLEEFGFLKFDILGLGTLRMFEECIKKIIRKERGFKHVPFEMVRQWFWEKLHPDNNDLMDPKVYEHVYWNNHYAGVFQFVKKNVQDFMAQMKPTNVIDIAIATSIFRPGPLGIGADKMYLDNRLKPQGIKYKHPLLAEVLADTSGLIVFQEQLQLIYHKLAGVPLEETDAVRKAFTKKDISNKEKAEKERQVMREDFANRCLAANQIDKRISYEIFDEMEKFVAYSFNKSHAVAYAITSYQCAWFLTYYPDEWITTYIDYSATEKGKVAGKEDPKVTALNEAKALGYKVGKPDINLSENEYTLTTLNGHKTLIPSFASLKHVGSTVVREIKDFRPYKTMEDLLWTENLLHTVWRHSKFNKRALATLVKMEAFDSMGLVGPDKPFKNYKQMHEVLIDKGDQIKKALARKKNRNHKELLEQFIQEAQTVEDWTSEEKLKNQMELSGSFDIGLICTPQIEEFLLKNKIEPIEAWENDQTAYWAIVQSSTVAQTRTGKKYLRLGLMGSDGSVHVCNVWSFGGSAEEIAKVQKNSIITSVFQKNDFGLSTNLRRVYKVKED